MNNDRRKNISAALELVAEAITALEEARDEEQEYFDDMPENLQSSERGENAEEAVSILDNAIDELTGVTDGDLGEL